MEEFKSNKDLKPLKGAHLVCNEDILGFIREAIQDVQDNYTDETHGMNPELAISDLKDVVGWTSIKDRFGKKVYKARQYAQAGQQEQKAELRVGVVLNGKRELMLDIRVWGTY
jgi:hypothetical protein